MKEPISSSGSMALLGSCPRPLLFTRTPKVFAAPAHRPFLGTKTQPHAGPLQVPQARCGACPLLAPSSASHMPHLSLSIFHGLTSWHKTSAQAARRRKGRFQLASRLRQVASVKFRLFFARSQQRGAPSKPGLAQSVSGHALKQHSEEVISRSRRTIHHTDQISATRPRHRLITAEGGRIMLQAALKCARGQPCRPELSARKWGRAKIHAFSTVTWPAYSRAGSVLTTLE